MAVIQNCDFSPADSRKATHIKSKPGIKEDCLLYIGSLGSLQLAAGKNKSPMPALYFEKPSRSAFQISIAGKPHTSVNYFPPSLVCY